MKEKDDAIPITLSSLPLSFFETFPNLTPIILYLNCSMTSVLCGIKLFKKLRITAHILVLYAPLERFGIITLLYTKALMLPQQPSPNTPIVLTPFSTNHYCYNLPPYLALSTLFPLPSPLFPPKPFLNTMPTIGPTDTLCLVNCAIMAFPHKHSE